jgi:hypothetical protein
LSFITAGKELRQPRSTLMTSSIITKTAVHPETHTFAEILPPGAGDLRWVAIVNGSRGDAVGIVQAPREDLGKFVPCRDLPIDEIGNFALLRTFRSQGKGGKGLSGNLCTIYRRRDVDGKRTSTPGPACIFSADDAEEAEEMLVVVMAEQAELAHAEVVNAPFVAQLKAAADAEAEAKRLAAAEEQRKVDEARRAAEQAIADARLREAKQRAVDQRKAESAAAVAAWDTLSRTERLKKWNIMLSEDQDKVRPNTAAAS